MKQAEVEFEFELAPEVTRPRTLTVIAVLTFTAAVVSYLAAYAMTHALLAAEILKPWPRGQDPRFGWFIACFISLMGLFLCIGALARFSSARQMRKIEQMEQEEAQDPRPGG